MTDALPCSWAPASDRLYRQYHDTEWGVPEYDSRRLWEKLQLDGMQAGLSWITILRKRNSLREAFEGFAPEKIARWDENRIQQALQNPGIIRSRKKIEACVGNARAYLRDSEKGESFSEYCWSYVDGQPVVHTFRDYREAPARSDRSERLARDLKKRGYKFVGPTIVYAWMQACGLYNDHETGCPRHYEVQEMTR